jgi:uncharacterized cupredoxin-like copper-binding protein
VVARAIVAALLVAGAALVMGCGGSDRDSATVGIRYSKFTNTSIEVAAGEPVTLMLVNGDPIDHEWIVGTADVHERHRTGTEPFHATRPTEVTIPALESRETTVVFTEPGVYQFICHLPGHEAYGMVGTLTVTES